MVEIVYEVRGGFVAEYGQRRANASTTPNSVTTRPIQSDHSGT
jgi:hypothetical protein